MSWNASEPKRCKHPILIIGLKDLSNLRNRRFPHLVAIRAGVVVGYAYVVLFRKRPAYRYTVKHSIYVHPDHLGRSFSVLVQERA